MVAEKPSLSAFPISAYALIYSSIGVVGLVLAVVLSVCVIRNRRPQLTYRKGVLRGGGPNLTNGAVMLKYESAIGPCGLKNSTSTLSSPLTCDSSSSSGNSPMVPARPLADGFLCQRMEPSKLGPQRGKINFSLSYSSLNSTLHVTIKSCNDLPALVTGADGQCLLDPYVKLQLLPEKQHRVKTRVVRASTNPQYDEVFTMYGIEADQLNSISLHFAVIAFDRYSRDTLLAEAIYNLQQAQAELLNGAISVVELELGGRGEQENEERGQLMLSFCYQPATARMTIVILKAKDLPRVDITGLADPYVKIYMLYKGQRICKKRSHVKKRTLSPVYNESFVFELPSSNEEYLEDIQFEVVVMDWDRITKDGVMGKCVIGPEDEHWIQVRNNPRRQIADWHSLTL